SSLLFSMVCALFTQNIGGVGVYGNITCNSYVPAGKSKIFAPPPSMTDTMWELSVNAFTASLYAACSDRLSFIRPVAFGGIVRFQVACLPETIQVECIVP